ncbi:streptomycin biosynthesis protein StrI [Powellomyces hirtus]|nr:streptomycin biosynthesis protein StrI [Powellomyces hirtus]
MTAIAVGAAVKAAQKVVSLAVVGAGERGKIYAHFALDNPHLLRITGLAEPSLRRRGLFTAQHTAIPPQHVFHDWRAMAAHRPRIADAVAICSLDPTHADAVVEFAKAGYHVLCEKPMAVTVADCKRIVEAVERAGVIFAVCHVLRYSPYNRALKRLIDTKAIGEIVNIVHVEPVGWWHFAHSYVRGNWAREDHATFSLMAKSCHDLDILCHYVGHDRPPQRVHSFGSLSHFRRDQKPAEAGTATRCIECAHEPNCPYSAPRLYLDKSRQDERGWPASVLVARTPPSTPSREQQLERPSLPSSEVELVEDIESITTALETGNYGRCVYESDNDVCDHQVVNVEFSNGVTASFTMVAFTTEICERQTRIHGTRGMIVGDSNDLRVTDFASGKTTTINPPEDNSVNGGSSGHGGGDYGLVNTFVKAVANNDQAILGCDPRDALMSHILVFAAEHARKSKTVVELAEFGKEMNCWPEGIRTESEKRTTPRVI